MATAQPTDAALLSDLGFLRRLAMSLTRDHAGADDLAQDGALIALERRPADLRTPRAWFRRVMQNLAINARRSSERRWRHESAAPERTPVLSPAQHAVRREMLEAVVAEVVRLEEPFGTAVIMRFYDDLSPKEIASRLGVAEGTARSRLNRGLAILRGRLDARVGPRDRWATLLAPAAFVRGTIGLGAKALVASAALVLLVAPVVVVWALSGERIAAIKTPAAEPRGGERPHAPAAGPAAAVAGPERAADERAKVPAGTGQDARGEDDPLPAPIRGLVVDAGDQRPVAGARISWVVLDTLPADLVARLQNFDEAAERDVLARAQVVDAGADGSFELPGTPLRIFAIARQGERWGMLKGSPPSVATIRMTADRSDWIEVADQDGRGRANVPVAIKRLGGPAEIVVWRGVTGSDGKAEVRHAQQLRPEGQRVGLVHCVDVFGSKGVEHPASGGPAHVKLGLPATAALRVLVKDTDQSPCGAGKNVTIRARSAASDATAGGLVAVTDATGHAAFPFVAPNMDLVVEAADPTGRLRTASEVVTTSDAGGSVDVVVAFKEKARSIKLRAVDAAGRPLPGRSLARANLDPAAQPSGTMSQGPQSVATGGDGSARIPAGDATSVDLVMPGEPPAPALGARITVPAGSAAVDYDAGDVKFGPLPVLARGRVRGADAASGAGVNLAGERELLIAGLPKTWSPEPTLKARTAADGRFVLRGFANGSPLRIRPVRNAMSSDGVVCSEGASDVEIVLSAPGRGRQRVPGPRGSIVVDAGVPLELLRASLTRRGDAGSPTRYGPTIVPLRELPRPAGEDARAGEFAFPGLEPGVYDFAIQSVGGSDPVTHATIQTSMTTTTFGSFGSFEGGVTVFQGPEIEVAEGRAADQRLESLDARGRLRVVKAVAVDPDGKAIPGAEVTVLTSEAVARKVGGGTTDARGRAVIVTSRDARRVAVRAGGWRTAIVPVGAAEQTIALGRGIPVRIVVSAAPGTPAGQALWARLEWTENPASRMPTMTDEGTAIARLADDGRVRIVDGAATLLLPAAGDYNVALLTEPEPSGQPVFVSRTATASEVINVKDAGVEQTFEIALPERAGSRRGR